MKWLFNSANVDENLFDFIVTSDDVLNVKPSSDLYLLAKRKFRRLGSKLIFAVEDSEVGMLSALNLNIKTIQIKDLCKVSALIQDKCIAKVNTLNEVVEIIRKYN